MLQPVGLFAIGVLAGIIGTLTVQRFPHLNESTREVLTGEIGRHGTGFTGIASVSQEQGENLLREVAAGRLVSLIMQHVKEGEWSKAVSVYRALKREYPNTLALNQVDRDYSRVLSKAIVMAERSL